MLQIAQKGLLVLQIMHFLFNMPVVYPSYPLFYYTDVTAHAQPQRWKGLSSHTTATECCNTTLQCQSTQGMCSTELLLLLTLGTCARVTVASRYVCVCLSVCYHANCYIPHLRVQIVML